MRSRLDALRRWLVAEELVDDVGIRIAPAPAVPLRAILRRFWPYARPYRAWLVLVLVFAVVVPLVDAAMIGLFKVVVDQVLVPHDLGLLAPIALAYLGLITLSGLLGFVDSYASTWVSERFVLDLRTAVFRHLSRMPLGFYEERPSGDLVSRLSGDIGAIESLLISGTASALSHAVRIVFFAGALIYLRWELALVSFAVAPLFWLVSRRVSARLKRNARERRRRSGSVSAAAQESLNNMTLVQAYGREAEVIDRFQRHGWSRLRAQMASVRARATFTPLIDLIEMCGVLVVLGMGTWELARGAMTLGGLLVFVAFLTQLYTPVRGLAKRLNSAYTASASAERVLELLDQKPRPRELSGAIHPGRAEGRLTITGVSYRYDGASRDALRDVTISVAPGEFVAIVGASGAGKSTLAKLMLRFDDPSEGVVALDDRDARVLTLAGLRDNIATVLQECLIFDGTILDNIAFGKAGATFDDVREAASMADADAFIGALPDGYATLVGQQGRRLSGGQRQRIAIARAFVRDAPVVLLDEPGVGLDPASFQRVMQPILRLAQGRATVVISHNLLTVRHATRIYVLDSGRLVEKGTHEELLRRAGCYASLYRHVRDRDEQVRFTLPVHALDGGRESAAEYHRAVLAIVSVIRDVGREAFHDELADVESRYWRLRPRYGEGALRKAKLAGRMGGFDAAP